MEIENTVAAEVIRLLAKRNQELLTERLKIESQVAAHAAWQHGRREGFLPEEIRAIKSARIRLLEAAQVETKRKAFDKAKACHFDADQLHKIINAREVKP